MNGTVGLAFNMKYGVYIARELHRAGLLRVAYCVPVSATGVRKPTFAPAPINRVIESYNERRIFPAAAGVPMRSVLAGDLALRVPVPLMSWSRRYWLSENLFDFSVARRLPRNLKAFHFASGIGLLSARRAKAHGAAIICQRRALHHEVEAELVGADLGNKYAHPEAMVAGRLDAEYDLADFLLCNSHFTARSFIERGYAAAGLEVVHNGIDLEAFSPDSEERPKRPNSDPLQVLFVGSIDYRKGVDTLAVAARHMGSRIQVSVVGPVRDDTLARKLNALDNVHLLGPLGGSRLLAQYRSADVTVLPSRADAFGYVVSESLACGTPVIVSDRCGSAELVRDGVDGYVFTTDSSESLIGYLERCEDSGTLAALRAGVLSGRDRLGWARYGSELTGVYRRRLPELFGQEVVDAGDG